MFTEKEGFDSLWEAIHLAERYDIAPMSTKGMSVTACRELAEYLSGLGVTILVLHDFDIKGFSILGTLANSTHRYTYRRRPNVIDLGLRLADIEDIEREPVSISSSEMTAATLRRHGATQAEIEILIAGERVELNALTSDELVALIERKLEENGIKKVISDDNTLADAYRRMHKQAAIQKKIDQLVEEFNEDEETIPIALRRRILSALKFDPTKSWDEALRELIDGQ
jgi:hypothetical protein